jgi:(p)ppGpp synthase/HD superfamily hydrolase
MSVCALVLEAGGDEDQAIAALLHEAMEDQGGLPTLNTPFRTRGPHCGRAVAAEAGAGVSCRRTACLEIQNENPR